MSGKPRFFCDNCGAEVTRGASRCTSCGRHFSSVLCPKCGFSGAENLFSLGCPSCGYSAPRRDAPISGDSTDRDLPAPSLPLWVYTLTVFCLLLVIAAAIVLLR